MCKKKLILKEMAIEGNELNHKTENSWSVKFSGLDLLVSDN